MPADLSIVQNYDASAGAGTWANATHAAIVDVGIAAGSVCILRYVVENCGVMINPLIVDDHVHGSAVQGSGGAMAVLATASLIPPTDVHASCGYRRHLVGQVLPSLSE
jgi:hypothetical protein